MIAGISNGQLMIELMNTLGYDAMALGNPEFDFGVTTVEANGIDAVA
jgi:2',3'-cyclic-nucleotide 2'-phosphodiesterase (5'-nucleotidase family)